MANTNTVVTSVRLPKSTMGAVRSAAKNDQRSVNQMIVLALDAGLQALSQSSKSSADLLSDAHPSQERKSHRGASSVA